MNENAECLVCGGEFPEDKLENGKCKVCKKEYPNANSLEEARQQTNPQKEQTITLTEARVREIAAEEIVLAGKELRKDVKEEEPKQAVVVEDQVAKMQKVRDAKKKTDKKETE